MEINNLKDSGNRTEFAGGAVRDMAPKGRCDLLPWEEVYFILEEDFKSSQEELFVRYFAYSMNTLTHKIEDFENFNNKDFQELNFLIIKLLRKSLRYFYGDKTEGILEVAYHYEDGAKKYSSRNWERGLPLYCFLDSAGRHFLKYMRGDADEPHDRAVIWNLLGFSHTMKKEFAKNQTKKPPN